MTEIPTGKYFHIGWDTIVSIDSDRKDINLTSLHEGFHNELNNVTIMGYILILTTFLYLDQQDNQTVKDVFEKLVSRSRLTHEIYATFLSTSVTSESEINSSVEDILRNYPNYNSFYYAGLKLVSGFEGNYLREIALQAVIISTFQSNKLLEAFKAYLSQPELIKEIQVDDEVFPDAVLNIIQSDLPEDFLTEKFRQFVIENESDTRTATLVQSETSLSLYRVLITKQFDSIQRQLLTYFISAIRDWLDTREVTNIDFSLNVREFRNLQKQVEKHVSVKANASIEDPMDYDKNVLVNASNEIYITSSKKLKARLALYTNLEKGQIELFAGGNDEQRHYYMCSKMAEDILNNYELNHEETQWLKDRKDNTLVFLRAKIIEGTKGSVTIYLVFFLSPEEIEQFYLESKEITKYTAIAMKTRFDANWNKLWLPTINSDSMIVFTYDIGPAHLYDYLYRRYGRIRLGKLLLKLDKHNFCCLVVCCNLQDALEQDIFYLIPSSEITCNIISNYLLNSVPDSVIVADNSFISQYSKELYTITSRIFNEERYFNFYIN